jgi:hypothetical protein
VNLHGIVSGYISAVNPNVTATVQSSSGYITNSDGSRVPTYTTSTITCQAQSLTYNDIQHLDSLNIQGVRRAIYLTGVVEGLVRVDRKGGDIITFPNGTFPEGNVWLAATVLESWSQSGWTKICITLQDGS